VPLKIIGRYSNQPHYIDFLGKLFQHLLIDTLWLEEFDSHFLTKICAFIPENLFEGKERSAEDKTESDTGFKQMTHRSPNDPDPTFSPIVSCLVSISQTSVPSVGISMALETVSVLAGLCLPTAETESSFDQYCSCR
jgi:hypothetical protein